MKYVEEYNGKLQFEFDEATKTTKKASATSSTWSNFSTGFVALFSSVFLPQGYPYTVTSDYLQYQIWDTVQAFASSLSSALSTSAVLRGVGVGNESATVLAASLTWLLKDGTGMVGRIIFAWAKGSALDSGRTLILGSNFRLQEMAVGGGYPQRSGFLHRPTIAPLTSDLLCPAGMLFIFISARRENLADVAAKDGSQETLVNVFSLIVSLIMLPMVDDKPELVWTLFVVFTGVHLGANYRAVRSLHLDTLNQSRLSIAVKQFIHTGAIPTIRKANEEEPLFGAYSGRFYGCQVERTFDSNGDVFKLGGYAILRYDSSKREGCISLETSATSDNQLDAAFHLEYKALSNSWPEPKRITEFRSKMESAGWNLSSHQLSFDEWRYRTKSA